MRVHNGVGVRVGRAVALTRFVGVGILLDIISHAMPVVELLGKLKSFSLSLMRVMKEFKDRLNGIGRQDNPGAVSKDEAISVRGDGEVGPHRSAYRGLGSNGFGSGGYSCTEGAIILINEVD